MRYTVTRWCFIWLIMAARAAWGQNESGQNIEFIENRGQWPSAVRYAAPVGPGARLFVEEAGTTTSTAAPRASTPTLVGTQMLGYTGPQPTGATQCPAAGTIQVEVLAIPNVQIDPVGPINFCLTAPPHGVEPVMHLRAFWTLPKNGQGEKKLATALSPPRWTCGAVASKPNSRKNCFNLLESA